MHTHLILGSSSPRRSEILDSMGYLFEVVSPQAEESNDETLGLEGLSIYNAEIKAQAVWNTLTGSNTVVLASDTVVWLDGKPYGKPTSLEHAYEMLTELSGKTHTVGSGVCLMSNQKKHSFCETAKVTFKKLSLDEIVKYVNDVWVMDKAGAYSIQEQSTRIVQEFVGEYEVIMGLPKKKLATLLNELNVAQRNK